MANIKSAKKRINTIQRRREENRYVKATISTMIKKFRKLIEDKFDIPVKFIVTDKKLTEFYPG